MLDCKLAINFIKERGRMCDSVESCTDCPLEKGIGCCSFMEEDPEKAIAIVQKWSDENPIRTIMMDFFEKFPNAPKENDGTPAVCTYSLGYITEKEYHNCNYECAKCWNRPLSIDKNKETK